MILFRLLPTPIPSSTCMCCPPSHLNAGGAAGDVGTGWQAPLWLSRNNKKTLNKRRYTGISG